MMLRELEGKEVIDAKADKFGKVSGIEIDCSKWRVTHLRIELDDDTVKPWGYKKPFLGHLQVLIPVNVVAAVSDVVNLKKSLQRALITYKLTY
ncbi:MAG: PRC-barrel domain-containing protein [Candidatus Bathyarchaeota archaeon]|nr:PRC-barrel domain-containing protein [Candidatus Bathyarchaeota archaeon]